MQKEKKNIASAIKKELDSLLEREIMTVQNNKREMKSSIERVRARVEHYENALGVELAGYSERSIYRKLREGCLGRQKRADKNVIKNRVLADGEKQQKLMRLAYHIYIKNAKANISLLVDLIQHHALSDHDYIEFAAVPRSTLYRFLNVTISNAGVKTVHEYYNHYNLYSTALPRVPGAFTSGDIKFMDYIIGDDHKADLASVYVFDEKRGELVKKQVKIWFWIEAVTMYPLGWIIKTDDLSAKDLIESLSKVLLSYGAPNKAIMLDNGIGSAEGVQSFLRKLEIGVHYAPAYEPTAKAPVERSFGMWKNELDVFFKNFVGPDKRKESRHSTKALSPEKTETTFEEYKKALENYLQGFFVTRERTRTVNGLKERISIHQYFERSYLTYEKIPVTERRIAFARQSYEIKKYENIIKLKGQTFVAEATVPVGFMGQDVFCFYVPGDMRAIYVYAAKEYFDRTTNTVIAANTFLLQMNNYQNLESPIEEVMRLKAGYNKAVKALAKAKNIKDIVEDPKLAKALTSNMEADGTVVNLRKKREKQLEGELHLVMTEKEMKKLELLTPDEDAGVEKKSLTFEPITLKSLTYAKGGTK